VDELNLHATVTDFEGLSHVFVDRRTLYMVLVVHRQQPFSSGLAVGRMQEIGAHRTARSPLQSECNRAYKNLGAEVLVGQEVFHATAAVRPFQLKPY
jgi:hypothetical protein